MAGHSVPIDFWVEEAKLVNPVERETLIQDLLPLIEPFSGVLRKVTDTVIPNGHFLLFTSDEASVSIKIYNAGLVQATLEYLVEPENVNKHKILIDDGRDIEKQLMNKFGALRCRVLPALKRAPPVNPYFSSSDDRILEYDAYQMLFNEISPFQKVQIFSTKSFGNLLVLDGLQNLAESDISAYTHALMNKNEENFKNKEVLILGGGDGSLLWELLKEKPNFVTMVDIDEVVIKACRQHMRAVCGDCMDKYDGENYKIIVGDAIAFMADCVKEGRKFDYVFGDLTDVPLSEDSKHDQLWEFMRCILNLGIKVLKPDGKYLTHTIGIQMEAALKTFENNLNSLDCPVKFTRTTSYVPSFKENWCFYQISLKS